MMIAGKTLQEWVEFARRDDCLERMVPSDLRELIGRIPVAPVLCEDCREVLGSNSDCFFCVAHNDEECK